MATSTTPAAANKSSVGSGAISSTSAATPTVRSGVATAISPGIGESGKSNSPVSGGTGVSNVVTQGMQHPKTVVASAATSAAPNVPPFEIQSLTNADRWIKLLVYGGYGAGKTRLCGTAARVKGMRDILCINAEAGDLTIQTEVEVLSDEDKSHIDTIRVANFRQFSRVQEFLKVHCTFRDMPFDEGEPKLKALEARLFPSRDPSLPARRYNTAIIDSATEIETYCMYQLLGITDNQRIDDDTAAPEWAEYKKNNAQMLRAIRAYRDLKMNLLITAAAAYVQDENKRFIYAPALTGKLAKQVQGFMDVVGFIHVTTAAEGGKVHRMLAHPTPRVDAKCRFSNFKQPHWDNPTIESILKSVGLLGAFSE